MLTLQNPWNDTQVTFKVILSLWNTLREYLQRTVFRHTARSINGLSYPRFEDKSRVNVQTRISACM